MQPHIDTLKTYEDLIASGTPAPQARAHVVSLNSAFDNVVTSKDLKILENDLKIFFTWELGLVLISALIIPTITKRFGWSN